MFLRNERSLGVKNGTLGMVEEASPIAMRVRTDDGRQVALDVKDYAHIDHGYAATIHKAQGMTVDRVHVLATPGLDAHTSYVALSRHRNRVDVHYGQDDFTDRSRLVRTLSRERGKDMASDYRRTAEPSQKVEPGRSMFDGLRLRADPIIEVAPTRDEPNTEPSPSRGLAEAVARHGRIVREMRFHRSVGVPYSPEQRGALAASRAALDALAPKGAENLERAMANDPRLIGEAANGNTQRAILAQQREADMRTDPHLRADMFVQRWQALERRRRLLLRDHETGKAGRIADSMIGMAKSLERDPQVESLLRNARHRLGLPDMPGRSVAHDLADMIGRGRGRSRGPEIGM